jgi:hypothetical protein
MAQLPMETSLVDDFDQVDRKQTTQARVDDDVVTLAT